MLFKIKNLFFIVIDSPYIFSLFKLKVPLFDDSGKYKYRTKYEIKNIRRLYYFKYLIKQYNLQY